MDNLQIARETAKSLVRTHFKNDYGEPFELTDGQADIFNLIYTRATPRNQIITNTQYGKSDTVSMALIMRSEVFNETWAIIAGQKDKAQIIMTRVIQHIFDHPRFYTKLDLDPDMPLDRLRRERSKDHITWIGGGGIKTFTANTRNRNQVKEALTGFGSPNIVEDESALVPDDVQAMVLRMLGGHADNFLLKIGNPFYRNHFLRSWQSDKYYKIFINYEQALREGRITQDFVDEMRDQPFFDILYEGKFPDENEISEGGYRKLITDELLESAFITEEEFKRDYCTKKLVDDDGTEIFVPEGEAKLGADFAGGGSDRSAYVVRWSKVMKLLETNKLPDTMAQVPIVEDYADMYDVDDANIAVDYGGLGQGVGDRLHEKDMLVNTVMFGQSAPDGEKEKYKNVRAYMYYKFLEWIKAGGKIVKDDRFYEFLVVNYKVDSERKFQIQPKEELKKIMQQINSTVTSPDVPDAAVLTFADNTELVDEDDFEIV